MYYGSGNQFHENFVKLISRNFLHTFAGPKPTRTKHPPDLVASIPVQILDSAPLHSIVISGCLHSLNNLAMEAAFSSDVVPRCTKKVAEAPIFLAT